MSLLLFPEILFYSFIKWIRHKEKANNNQMWFLPFFESKPFGVKINLVFLNNFPKYVIKSYEQGFPGDWFYSYPQKKRK